MCGISLLPMALALFLRLRRRDEAQEARQATQDIPEVHQADPACSSAPKAKRLMERLGVKLLREEAVAQARKEFEGATTTKERHYARLALQRAIRQQTEELTSPATTTVAD